MWPPRPVYRRVRLAYGYVPRGQKQSITELRYRAAVQHGKDRLIFLLDEDLPWQPRHIEGGSGAERLNAFKDELRQDRLCSHFCFSEQLQAQVAAAVANWQVKRQPRADVDRPDTTAAVDPDVYQGPTVARLAYRQEIGQLLAFYTQLFAGREAELGLLMALSGDRIPTAWTEQGPPRHCHRPTTRCWPPAPTPALRDRRGRRRCSPPPPHGPPRP
jgi:hypothetical protein